jgi:hypothetical protein
MTITVNATLLQTGNISELKLGCAAVFQCASEEDCRKLGACLYHEGPVTLQSPEPDGALAVPRQYLRVPLTDRTCPECGEGVTVLGIEHPVVANLLVDPTPTESIVKQPDGSWAIAETYVLHSSTCPKWPDEQRDWRTCIVGATEQEGQR